MDLEIQTIWSPDLNPPSSGYPSNRADFAILLQVSIGERGKAGGEVFSLDVVSPSQLCRYASGTIISYTLVLDYFDWQVVEDRLSKLLRHAALAKNWEQVVGRFTGLLACAD